LGEVGFETTHFSLLNIEALHFNLPSVDPEWIFFYSKNGIKYFFKQQAFNTYIRYGVMGSGSAAYFERVTKHQPNYIASKPGSELLGELDTLLGDSVMWIPQGTESLNFLENLSSTKNHYPLKVYQNTKIKNFDISGCSHLAFTSPLNAQTYFEKYNYNGEIIFAIGATTAGHILSLIQRMPYFPDEPGIQNLIDLIIEKASS
ncbi:MAG: hypothetical protein HKN09_04835, partial [Saprospiraceae bacterium]|nr:hypothetical protein [Saprospiraceae bacterium]